jgi:mitochondrial fission protein ELM1
VPGGPPLTWVLADDRPGNVNQALAVAEALGWPFVIKSIRYRALARLPNLLLGASALGLTAASRRALVPPWPALVIAAGRRSAPVARWLKGCQPATFLVQLMWPGSARGLDLVVVPRHDGRAEQAGVLRVPGVPHRITPARLAEAAAALAPRLQDLPRPYIACLIGGSSRHRWFTRSDALELASQANALAGKQGGSLLVTTSRRTGAACAAALACAITAPRMLHQYAPGSDNPYLGLLGAADAIVVTADSASMCVEACASGKPVFLFRPAAGAPAKLTRLHRWLEREGYLRPLGAPWPGGCPRPLNPAASVAEAVRARLLGPTGRALGRVVASESQTA